MTHAMRTGILIALGVTLIGCGGEEQPSNPNAQVTPTPQSQAKRPTVFAASPELSADQMAVGETLRILGTDFISSVNGQAMIAIRGTYFDETGQQYPFDQTFEGDVRDASTIHWRMYPNIVFHPNGNRLGQFVGTVQVINQGFDGSTATSSAYPITLTIKPSLILKEIRPTEGCSGNVIDATLEDVNMRMAVEAIGLRPPTQDAQMVFHWTFESERWDFAGNGINISFDPSTIFPRTGPVTIQDRRTEGVVSTLDPLGGFAFYLPFDTQVFTEGRLQRIMTKKIDQGENYTTTINVTAVDATGKSARLAIPLNVFKVASMAYNNDYVIAERYEPVPVTSCIPGGNFPKNLDYREDRSESRSRDIGFNFNAGLALNWGLPSNPFALGLNFNVGFGVDVRGSVSSSESQALDISGQLIPGAYAAFYRQTTKVLRIGRLLGHSKCGEEVDLGEAIVTDWIFAPDLAIGPSCMPRSNLPPAQKFR